MSAALNQQSSHAIDFDEFFREHHQRLIACGLALTGSAEKARDAAQETLVRAFDRWAQVQTMEHPGAWLRKVLLNLLVDEGRRTTRRHLADARVREAHPDEPHDTSTTLIIAIRALPLRQRQAVVLHYLDDLPIAEVSTAMGVAVGTVKATLSQARAALAAALHEEHR